MLKAILVDCIPHSLSKEDAEYHMAEAESLIKTYGGVVLVKRIQKRSTPDYRTYIGSGKLQEIIEESKSLDANILIINNELKPQQTYNLNELLREAAGKKAKAHLEAWDRIDVILKIFQKHATTREAKLEIELASIKHMGPRIFGMGMQLSRQGGGIGTKGVGETNTEFMKRHLAKMERRIKTELDDCKRVRKLHRAGRRRQDIKTIGIIGYTNAGKTSLLNALTQKGAYAADKLFATLDTRVGKMLLENPSDTATQTPNYQNFVLISDTIGFIQDLPTTLINSFQSTLEETIEADLLLHVIDITDPRREEKIAIVNDILAKIEALHKPAIYVFNKMDKASAIDIKPDELAKKYKIFHPCFISTYTGEGIDELKKTIAKRIMIKNKI
jgi:GTP-binding protein HflX